MTIQSPIAWGLDQIRLAILTPGSTSSEEYWPQAAARPAELTVRRIGTADIRAALAGGFDDFAARRTDVMFLCAVYPLAGLFIGRLAFGYGVLPLLFPLASGFALIGPLAGVGLTEMSRRRELGEDVTWTDAFRVVRSPSIGAIAALSLMLLAIFVFWLLAAQAIYELTLGPLPPVSLAAFAHDVVATRAGWVMIGAGLGTGFVLACLVLAVSVVSFPLLLDGDVGLETAIRTSVRTVIVNPGPIALWGAIIAAALVVGSIPFLIGLAVIMPILGHATWHLYRRVVRR